MAIAPVASEQQSIQAYFSHSYRAEDSQVNLFFWRLFSDHSFFFTVDPKSDRTFVPHLERMMRQGDCFIAVVTRRLETVQTIGSVLLPQPQVIWTHSPYIQFEHRLAFRSGKPRLIFVESGLDANLFGGPEEVQIFDRDLLDKRERLYNSRIQEFAQLVHDYKRYADRQTQPSRRAGILINTNAGATYDPEVIQLIKQALQTGGYMATLIQPAIGDDQQFIRDLAGIELLVSETRPPFISPTVLAFVHARFLPTIRLCALDHGESRNDVVLPEFLSSYNVGDLDPVVAWRSLDTLALEIVQHVQKFQQTRTLLDTFEQGRRYFLSAGRRKTKVFISNAHNLNDLALDLIKGFQSVNVQFFHYQATMRIGSAWQDELKRELEECDLFILLISDEYHTSKWCQYEMERAFERWMQHQVVILPYLISHTRLPDMLKDHIQCAFMYGLPFPEVVRSIVETVDRYLADQEQTPAAVRDRVGAFEHALDRSAIQSASLDLCAVVAEVVDGMSRSMDVDQEGQAPARLVDGMCQVGLNVQRIFGDLLHFPATLPLLFCQQPQLGPQEIDSLRQLVVSQTRRMVMVVLPATSDRLAEVQQALDSKIRQVHACDVVLLSHSDLKLIIRDDTPGLALRRAVLAQINILNYVPFVINGSTPDHIFFGREPELREICEHARAASYALIGGRRIGKTSTLGRLHRVRLPAAGFRTIYHDCATTPTYKAFLAVDIHDWRPDPPQLAPVTLGDLIQSQAKTNGMGSSRPLVLLLDEVDKLIANDRADDWRLFNALRALGNSGRVEVVLSGERVLREALQDATSPLFNFVNEMLIGRLDFRAVEELITRPMRQLEIELDDETAMVHRIYDFTSGHPNVVQRLCHRLIERLNAQGHRRIGLYDVNMVIEDPDFIRKDFLETYFSRASTLEHLCALVMAGDGSLRTVSAIYQALTDQGIAATLNQVDAALERLVDLRSILIRTPHGYDFVVTAFPLILAKSRRSSDWIALRREVFAHAGDIAPELAPPALQGRLW